MTLLYMTHVTRNPQGRRRGLRRQLELPGDAVALALLAVARADRRIHPGPGTRSPH